MNFNWPISEYSLYNNKDIKILYIDSGCDINHIEIRENIMLAECKSFVDNNLTDYTGHGTQIISAITGKYQMQGLAPKSKIIMYKITNFKGETMYEDLYNALREGIKKEYKVINISISGFIDNPSSIQELINKAKDKGILICWSTYNNLDLHKRSQIDFIHLNYAPYCFYNIFKVGSLNNKDKVSSFVIDYNINIYAPGGDIIENDTNQNSLIKLANTNLKCDLISYEFGLPNSYTLNVGNSIATSYSSACLASLIDYFEGKTKKQLGFDEINDIMTFFNKKSLNIIANTKEIIDNGIF